MITKKLESKIASIKLTMSLVELFSGHIRQHIKSTASFGL